MTTSKRETRRAATILIFVVALGTVPPGVTAAQERKTIAYRSEAAHSKFVQQHTIDVGDVPGHQVRIYEHHRTFPSNPPMFSGVRVLEVWNRAFSDYTALNGHAWGYSQYMLEGGDKIFARYDGTTQTTIGADGSKKTTFAGIISLTGGTGKFRGIRGTIRTTSVFDPKANVSETQDEGEYWIE
jgi:hypothetical protein